MNKEKVFRVGIRVGIVCFVSENQTKHTKISE